MTAFLPVLGGICLAVICLVGALRIAAHRSERVEIATVTARIGNALNNYEQAVAAFARDSEALPEDEPIPRLVAARG